MSNGEDRQIVLVPGVRPVARGPSMIAPRPEMASIAASKSKACGKRLADVDVGRRADLIIELDGEWGQSTDLVGHELRVAARASSPRA